MSSGGRIVTGGRRGFIGSHVVEGRCWRAATEVDGRGRPLERQSGEGERARGRPRLVERATCAQGSPDVLRGGAGPRSCFHLAAQVDVRVSVERPEHDALRETCSARSKLLEGPRGRTRRRSSSARPAARSTANAKGLRRKGGRAPAARAPMASPSSPVRSTLAAYNRALRHAARLRLRYGQRLRAAAGPARRGRRGRDLPRLAGPRAGRRESSATAWQTARLRLCRRRGACQRWPAAGQDGGRSSTSAPGAETSVVEPLRGLPPRDRVRRWRRSMHPSGSASCSEGVLDVSRSEARGSVGGPRCRSRRACRLTWESISA